MTATVINTPSVSVAYFKSFFFHSHHNTIQVDWWRGEGLSGTQASLVRTSSVFDTVLKVTLASCGRHVRGRGNMSRKYIYF